MVNPLTVFKREELRVIKFGGLPSKCISLILKSYNLKDRLSLQLFSQDHKRRQLLIEVYSCGRGASRFQLGEWTPFIGENYSANDRKLTSKIFVL